MISQLDYDFNQDNAMAAGLACLRLELSFKTSKMGLPELFQGVYMEVLTQTKGAKVFVDYAHKWR